MIASLALALALALAAAPPDAPPPARAGEAKETPPPLSAEDAAVVEHLELLEGLELLEDLPGVADEEREDPPHPP